jgi:hypothetical protein
MASDLWLGPVDVVDVVDEVDVVDVVDRGGSPVAPGDTLKH